MQPLKLILEKKKEKKEEKIVFIETDPQEAFPTDTIAALRKGINRNCKDLEKEWNGAVEVVDATFEEFKVPKPLAHLRKRWQQYNSLIAFAVKNLYDARGLKAPWVKSF